MATIRTSGLPADFKPKPQTQAVADAVEAQFGLKSFGTYAGHEPTADLGLDIFVDKATGDRVAAWLVENIERLGIDYVIWWQRIYNPEIATHWRDMADRGGTTQNHKDHIHVSLESSAPKPHQPQEDDFMATMSDAEKAQLLDDTHETRKFLGPMNEHLSAMLEILGAKIAKLEGDEVDVDKLAAALSKTLGADIAKALGERLANG